MDESRVKEPIVEMTLGPGGTVLHAHPSLRSILQLAENAQISFPAVYAAVQPKNIFLTLCNTEGTGVFTILGKLFEIRSKKIDQGNASLITFQAIGDDNSPHPGIFDEAFHSTQVKSSIKPFDLTRIFDLVFDRVKTAQTCVFYRLETESHTFLPQYARGFKDDDRIMKIILPENKAFLAALRNKEPLILNRLNFFEDYNLTTTSIFEYRSASGGKIPLSGLILPLIADTSQASMLVLENYNSPEAFSADEFPGLLTEIANVSVVPDRPNYTGQKDLEIQLQAIDSIVGFIDSIDLQKDVVSAIKQQLSFLIPFDSAVYFQNQTYSQNRSADRQGYENLDPTLIKYFTRCVPIRLDVNDRDIFQKLGVSDQSSNLMLPIYHQGNLDGVFGLSNKAEDAFTQAHINSASLFLKFLDKKLSTTKEGPNASQAPLETGDFRHSEKLYSQNNAIWEAIFDGILVTDSINRLQFTNKALSKYLNLPFSQITEPNINTVSNIFKTTLSNWKRKILDWSIDPDAINPGESFSEQVRLQNGRVLSIHLTPVMLKKEFLGTVSIFRDVSYEYEFDRLKTDFITSISHELRTPLTSIQGYVDLLLMGVAGNLSDDQRGFMSIVKNNSERLNNLINDMLELTTIEAGKVNLMIHPTDIFELASEVLERFKDRSEKENKAIEFYLETDPAIPLVLADPERAKQILENLVSNAYSCTEVEGRITITLKNSDQNLQINISDTGVGISKEQKDQIFDHFTWVDNPTNQPYQGVGLGLPIVKQLVELQNGKIWVESSGIPGEGSTFSFTLPTQVQP